MVLGCRGTILPALAPVNFFCKKNNIKYLIYGTILGSIIFKTVYFILWGNGGMMNAFTLSCTDALGFGALIAYWSIFNPELMKKMNQKKYIVPLSFLPFA